ncbi:hypothetical protein ACFYMW_19155 [Streptomyces sp. NPDC006692]|uniref:hypothetical protein n=1 Tax=unclassified Streptomyces TaxID=2593676 RepID=UPI0036C9F6D8
MPASALPARARTRATAVVALAVAGTALIGAPAAVAAPGDNGDVKIHAMGTLFTDPRNEPKVCGFYLDAFNFDVAQGVTWDISTQPERVGGATLSGAITLAAGLGHTLPLTLPNGQYKLVWNVTGGNGVAKEKIFQVDCTVTPGTRAAGGPPRGGVAAGGGGLAETPGIPQAGGVAAVGLVSVAGVLFVRRLRRRRDGAA